jgi:hypothetical protein
MVDVPPTAHTQAAMIDDPNDATEYRIRITQTVLNAVIAVGVAEGSGGGMVNLEVALLGMCDAIASLVAAAGVNTTEKDRRQTAELCRKRILATSDTFARLAEAGKPISWTFESMDPKH